jgi:hypothetical protein
MKSIDEIRTAMNTNHKVRTSHWFHEAVANAFAQLKDAHTLFIKPGASQ